MDFRMHTCIFRKLTISNYVSTQGPRGTNILIQVKNYWILIDTCMIGLDVHCSEASIVYYRSPSDSSSGGSGIGTDGMTADDSQERHHSKRAPLGTVASLRDQLS